MGLSSFWAGKRVLLTGHTGFKGAWLSLLLRHLGAEVAAFSLPPETEPALIDIVGFDGPQDFIDLRDEPGVRRFIAAHKPEIVLHLAAQALVRPSYADPLATFQTNVMGTVNLLSALRDLPTLEAVLVVTSDKVYRNAERGDAFREEDEIGGADPYSASKACCELVTYCFRESFFKGGARIATARAGNVIGGGDWSRDRIVPDCMRALASRTPVVLRYPESVRPWQHVLEPLVGYLAYAEALFHARADLPSSLNFGPAPENFSTVRSLVEAIMARFGMSDEWRRSDGQHPAEAKLLTLDATMAMDVLHWRPRLSFADTIAQTADWYAAHAAGDDMRAFTLRQIQTYLGLAESP